MHVLVLCAPISVRDDGVLEARLGGRDDLTWGYQFSSDAPGEVMSAAMRDAVATGRWPAPIRATWTDADGRYALDDVAGEALFVRAFVHDPNRFGRGPLGQQCNFASDELAAPCWWHERSCQRWIDVAGGVDSVQVDFDPQSEVRQRLHVAARNGLNQLNAEIEIQLGARWLRMPYWDAADDERLDECRVWTGDVRLPPIGENRLRVRVLESPYAVRQRDCSPPRPHPDCGVWVNFLYNEDLARPWTCSEWVSYVPGPKPIELRLGSAEPLPQPQRW